MRQVLTDTHRTHIASQEMAKGRIIALLDPHQKKTFIKDKDAFLKLDIVLANLCESDRLKINHYTKQQATLKRRVSRLKHFDYKNIHATKWRMGISVILTASTILSCVIPYVGLALVLTIALTWLCVSLISAGTMSLWLFDIGATLKQRFTLQSNELDADVRSIQTRVASALAALLDENNQNPEASCFIDLSPIDYCRMENLKLTLRALTNNRVLPSDPAWLSVTSEEGFKFWLEGTAYKGIDLPKMVVHQNAQGQETLLTKSDFLAWRIDSLEQPELHQYSPPPRAGANEEHRYRFYGNPYQIERMRILKYHNDQGGNLNNAEISAELVAARNIFRPIPG